MNLPELLLLEKHLEYWISHIRSAKVYMHSYIYIYSCIGLESQSKILMTIKVYVILSLNIKTYM